MTAFYQLFTEILKRLMSLSEWFSLLPNTSLMWWSASALLALVLTCLPFVLLGFFAWFIIGKIFPRWAMKINLLKYADKLLVWAWFQYFLIVYIDLFFKAFGKEFA